MNESAELDLIAAEAAQVEAGAEVAQNELMGGGALMVQADPAQEWREAAHLGCGLILAMRPQLKPDWTADKLDALGNALHKCAEKYGWTVGGIFGHPLVGLCFAAWPLGASLYQVEKSLAEEKAKKAREAKSAGVNPVQAAQGNVAADMYAH